jgi:hypothetical protein
VNGLAKPKIGISNRKLSSSLKGLEKLKAVEIDQFKKEKEQKHEKYRKAVHDNKRSYGIYGYG